MVVYLTQVHRFRLICIPNIFLISRGPKLLLDECLCHLFSLYCLVLRGNSTTSYQGINVDGLVGSQQVQKQDLGGSK